MRVSTKIIRMEIGNKILYKMVDHLTKVKIMSFSPMWVIEIYWNPLAHMSDGPLVKFLLPLKERKGTCSLGV